MIMIYKLTSIPDISLSKYQNMSVGGIEGLKEYADDFLRQWQKVSAIYDIEINYIVRFVPESKKGNKLGCYVVFKYEDERLSGYISNLMKSSQLTDLYGIVYLEENPFECSTFKEKFVLKKCERKRKYEVGNDDKIDLFYVETWEANKNSRLIDLYNTMQTFNTEIVYRVVLTGSDAYEDIFSSLEKPIEYLKNRSLNGEQNAIKLSDNTKWVNNKNAFSNEILRTYEQFLKSVSNAPCFKGNVIVYSNDDILGNMIFSSVCGECIEKGNWENIVLKNGPFNVLDDYEEFCDIMPRTLKYWPTYYTLDEVKSFFRPPMLYDAENIEMRTEDNPIEEIIELSKGSRKIHDHISDDLAKAITDIDNYYKNGDNEKALESLLLVNVDEKDLWGIKKLLIISAMTEGATDEETEKYMVIKQFYKDVYLLLDDTKSEKTYIDTVDEIIAETIRCSYTKVFTKVDEMLDEFLEYTCKTLDIPGSQYNILQKVFAYFEAYEQEKRILENMVNNYITRSSEQEDRLTFLQKGSYTNFNLGDSASQGSGFIEDGNMKYEYRSVNWDNKKIEEYFENLSLQNRAVEYPFVVQEWNKEVSINISNFDVEAIGRLIADAFIENYGERFSVRLGTSKTMDNYSEPMDTISIMADSDEEAKNGYSWIEYFVTAEKISNKQVAFAIYTLYFPALDMEVSIDSKSIIEKNKICVQKINLLKEKQNPRINRHIQNINNLIIEVLENWTNDVNKNVDIYG